MVKIRLRLLQNSTEMQESIVSITLGLWAGNLVPPTGGWKEGDGKLEATGLDSKGSPVNVEKDTISLKFEK